MLPLWLKTENASALMRHVLFYKSAFSSTADLV